MKSTVLLVSEDKIPVDVPSMLKGEDLRFVENDEKNLASVLIHESVELVIFFFNGDKQENILNLLESIKVYDDNLPLIVVSQSKSVEDAVEIMKVGAYDFFNCPVDEARFRSSVLNAIKLYSLTKRVFLLENQIGLRGSFDNIIGASSVMQDVFNTINMVAKSNATVLILGESGTGKELVAKAIHKHSPRVDKVFMDINCGAIPSELLENEMFGHERGAYTGADKRYIGSFERAHGGTIFLDEIGEMSPQLQVRLLRFLQERNFNRVGGSEPISVDVRIVTATNRDLAGYVEEGLFREDLYYRLNVVPILIPPLRERREDIPILVKYFLEKLSAKNEKIFLDFTPQAMEALVSYDWPGNVRELENAIERVVVLHNDTKVKTSHLSLAIRESCNRSDVKPIVDMAANTQQKVIPLDLVERYAIEAALRQCYGNVAEAAAKLKIGQATLYRKIKQYGLKA